MPSKNQKRKLPSGDAERSNRSLWLGGLGIAVAAVAASFALRTSPDATAEVLACAWQQCASPENAEILGSVAAHASKTKATHGQDMPPQRAMWTYCLLQCLDRPRPSEEALAIVRPILEATKSRNVKCAQESEWTLVAEGNDSVVAKAAEILQRCGLVRLLGLWKAEDFAWMDRALEAFHSLSEADVEAWGRVERQPRRTEDVLVPLEDKQLWTHMLSHFVSSPTISGIIAGYYGKGAARLSYASWIAAPEAASLDAQPLHSDLNAPKAMLSVHLALHDISKEMGPTSYCPGTHLAGSGETAAAGPAGPLELPFALRTIAVQKGGEPCLSVTPSHTPRGAVTLYDSALLHRGEPNRAAARVLLNLNVASSQWGIDEENYLGYFQDKRSMPAVKSHLDWMRHAFDAQFFQRVSEMERPAALSLARFRISSR